MSIIPPFVGLYGIWLLLTWSLDGQDLLTGGVLCAVISLFLIRLGRLTTPALLQPRRWFWFVVYVFYFLYYCLRANLDVAYRALHPDLPIRPGIVKVPTTLTSDVARTFLANSITLTPGTLTIDIQDDHLFIHWINVQGEHPDEQAGLIVKRFETILRRIFE